MMTRPRLWTGLLIAGFLVVALSAAFASDSKPGPADNADGNQVAQPAQQVADPGAAERVPVGRSENTSTGLVHGVDRVPLGGGVSPADGADTGQSDTTCPNQEPCGP